MMRGYDLFRTSILLRGSVHQKNWMPFVANDELYLIFTIEARTVASCGGHMVHLGAHRSSWGRWTPCHPTGGTGEQLQMAADGPSPRQTGIP